MASKLIDVGRSYRDLSVSSPNANWIIERLFKKADGVEYVELRSASDRTRRKMLALSVVMDPRRFELAK